MKTILYNPIFINPQAYYVFPRLTRYLQPDNESTAEPANYIGTIEVKVIAYGDTTLKRTYTNTDSIDLSEFKNTWIRISLFTKVGSCVLGEWKIGNMESDLPYIDPEVLASLKAVVIVGNKTNNDSDRAIVKNLVDPDNPFVISNAAYTEGSGYADKGSPYYGAFVTDGVDDLITSTKTVQEMGITDEVTVVSMIHQIDKPSNFITTNNIRTPGSVVGRNGVSLTDKTGIYGWYKDNIQGSTINVINNILGDKADYTASASSNTNLSSKFSVVGYISNDSIVETSQVAWYWTIIANKVLTTDQINQVIAYFNLDRTLKPDILCNTIKQGITNENHAEFGDKLIDFSGNGRDIQLNNIGWKGDSGIGKYSADFESFDWVTDVIKKTSTQAIIGVGGRFCNHTAIEIDEMKVNIEGNVTDLRYWYIANPDDTTRSEIRLTSGINTLPKSYAKDDGQTYNIGFAYISGDSEITIEQIPSHAGALCLDGVNDFGKVTGMPVYKDYTIIADYERFYLEPITGGRASILSKSSKVGDGSFIFNLEDQNGGKACYTFGEANGNISDDITRIIRYQSKYYNTKALSIGTAKDNDFMVLGKVREVDNRYFYGAIYSLMTFPYSMSEFLIERQLKKHKLGTLYPDMVEFRPIIKSNVNYQDIIFRNTSTGENLIVGQYYNLESISIYVKPLYYEEVSTIKVNNINAEFNSYDKNTGYYRFDCIVTKSPQKINLTIEQDENYVKFEPVIKSNASYDNIVFYYKNEKVENETYLTVGSSIGMHIRLSSNPVNEIKSITINGIPATFKFHDANNNIYQYDFNLTSKSPQKINITIDEYIRYEDIVQPYPLFFEFTDENGNLISWGGKAKVGSTITRTKGVNYANLLEGLFTITNPRLNGVPLASSQHVVEKSMVFTCTATWAFDNNEPKCILSPRLLRIPNSSYKILGYIPDISGHGNHGKINNSAYAEGSGVNEDGSYQFDGVDDFVTIPTLSSGGKQMLMKVNWNSLNHVLYDQRNNAEAPFCIVAASGTIAYNQRNVGGNTYIDGILNNHILVDDLQAITHNIVLNNDYNVANSNSFIGTNYTKSIYAKMSLYDFMLFDDISTDDKIKELNEYVGIEAKVELPPYYWDNYGKTNSDADRDVIQQRGIAVGDYDLTNYNHAYEGMSGYNGYPVVFGANKTWETLSSVYSYISDVTSTTIHVTMVKNAGTGLLFSYVKKDEALTNIKEIPAFRVTIKGLEGNSKFGYRYLATEDATGETLVYLGNGTHELAKSFAPTEALLDLTRNTWVGIFITPMVEGEVVFDCDITIEVLPEYENGLVYDGVEDFSKNANIPALTDYTYVIKRENLNNNVNSATMYKGNKAGGGAFIVDYIASNGSQQYSYGNPTLLPLNENTIIYGTKTSYNGSALTVGSNTDENGLEIGHWSSNYKSIVLYKLVLYPKTIPLLQINFLKNLMEKDEIIDLTNPIFIQE